VIAGGKFPGKDQKKSRTIKGKGRALGERSLLRKGERRRGTLGIKSLNTTSTEKKYTHQEEMRLPSFEEDSSGSRGGLLLFRKEKNGPLFQEGDFSAEKNRLRGEGVKSPPRGGKRPQPPSWTRGKGGYKRGKSPLYRKEVDTPFWHK